MIKYYASWKGGHESEQRKGNKIESLAVVVSAIFTIM